MNDAPDTLNKRLTVIADECLAAGITDEQFLFAAERVFILRALTRADGNKTKASHYLGFHRNTLHNKLRILAPETIGGKFSRRRFKE